MGDQLDVTAMKAAVEKHKTEQEELSKEAWKLWDEKMAKRNAEIQGMLGKLAVTSEKRKSEEANRLMAERSKKASEEIWKQIMAELNIQDPAKRKAMMNLARDIMHH